VQKICVVDVAVDLVGDDAGIVFFQAHLMRGHAEAHEVIGFEHFQSLLFRQSQDNPLRSFDSIVTNALFNLEGAAPLQLHGFRFRSGPLDGLGLRNQAEVCGVCEIQFQAVAIFRIQRKIDVVAQVRFEGALWQFQFARRVERNFGYPRQNEISRSEKICGHFGTGNVSPGRPNCQDGGQIRSGSAIRPPRHRRKASPRW